MDNNKEVLKSLEELAKSIDTAFGGNECEEAYKKNMANWIKAAKKPGPITAYAIAWEAFQGSRDYERCRQTLANLGMKQHFIDNLLEVAFAAGYNAS